MGTPRKTQNLNCRQPSALLGTQPISPPQDLGAHGWGFAFSLRHRPEKCPADSFCVGVPSCRWTVTVVASLKAPIAGFALHSYCYPTFQKVHHHSNGRSPRHGSLSARRQQKGTASNPQRARGFSQTLPTPCSFTVTSTTQTSKFTTRSNILENTALPSHLHGHPHDILSLRPHTTDIPRRVRPSFRSTILPSPHARVDQEGRERPQQTPRAPQRDS